MTETHTHYMCTYAYAWRALFVHFSSLSLFLVFSECHPPSLFLSSGVWARWKVTVVSPGVIDGNRVMTLLNGRPAATFTQALICIQIRNLFVDVCLCRRVRSRCARRPRTYFSLSNMASMCFLGSVYVHTCTCERMRIGSIWKCWLRKVRSRRNGFALTCTHTGIHTSQGVSLQIGFSPLGWQSWQALYERNKQGCFTSLPPLSPSFQLKASNLLLNWWT